MREIKFRGLTSHSKEWRYGNLAKINDSYHIFEQCDLTEDGHHIRQDSDRPTWIEEETIGQFTGLCDKNGKEIYEGDVLLWKERKLFVKWRQEDCRYVLIGCHDNDYVLNAYKCNIEDDFRVIGNIYDNPEFDEK